MIEKAQLPFALRLIDDKSPRVREKIAQDLRARGPALWQEIQDLQLSLTVQQESALQEILGEAKSDDQTLEAAWRQWLQTGSEEERLETAFDLLAQWQLGENHPVRLSQLLNDLALEFMQRGHMPDYEELSQFLFIEKGLCGSSAEDYYNPLNSNLVHVIEAGHGVPISLASIFILVGKRLDLEIHGCNFPGHFMARARDGSDDLVFDCFNDGRLLAPSEVAALRKAAPSEMAAPASTETIIARVLRNLAKAYYQKGDSQKTRYVLSLLSMLERAVKQ